MVLFMKEIILSTLQNDLSYLKNMLNFFDFISDCFSSSSADVNFEMTSEHLYYTIKELEDLISDIQLGNTSFEFKK